MAPKQKQYPVVDVTGDRSKVRCLIQDAWGLCTEMTQTVGMGSKVGGGFRMGNTCIPVADSC